MELVPFNVIVVVPVGEIVNGVPPPSVRVPVWAPVAIDKVEVLLAFAFAVVTEPFTMTLPLSMLKTPFLILLVAVK